MAKVIVSVMLKGSDRLRDFEIPSSMSAGDIAESLGKIMAGSTSLDEIAFQIEAANLGRMLAEDETLEEAGVWDGSILVLHKLKGRKESASERDEGIETPLVGWKALDISSKKEKTEKPKGKKKFAWKRLD